MYLVMDNTMPLIYTLRNDQFAIFWGWNPKNGTYDLKFKLG